MAYPVAAHKISELVRESLRCKRSGIPLQDDSDASPLPTIAQEKRPTPRSTIKNGSIN
ncbi:MAG: hypothetical protein ACYC3N_12030 [Halothiobacillus sp.]